MTTTVKTLIEGAMRLLGELESGESASTEELNDGLEALNMMLANYAEDGLIIPSRTLEELSIETSKNSYTIGVGGDFNTKWPVSLVGAFTTNNQGEDKQDLSNSLWYEPSHPLGMLFFEHAPSAGRTLHLLSLKPMGQFATADDEIKEPESYNRMIKFNLAIEIAPEFNAVPSDDVKAIAYSSKDAIERRLGATRVPKMDGTGGGMLSGSTSFDINSGE